MTLRTVRAITCILLLSASTLAAWPGHQWETWKQLTTWKRPSMETLQAGHKELIPPLAPGPDAPNGIDGIRAWEARRKQTERAIRAILGQRDAAASRPDSQPARRQFSVESLGIERLPDHTRQRIRIQSDEGDWIPAYVMIPSSVAVPTPGRGTTNAAGRRPAMICLHQTVAQGKDEPAGIKGDPELAFAAELVARGYVCIAPDVIGFGERIPPGAQPYHDSASFYRRYPGWSFMGKMVSDLGRVVDYLETLPEVDPLQIGCIGHSHGAYGTIFGAAFEPRIAVAIASCGLTTFRSDPVPSRWSHLTALIPQIGEYLPKVEDIPFDWQDLCAMIAPRPLYVWYATKDSIFPATENLDALFRDVQKVYGLYGAADDLTWKAFDGEHRFPKEGREHAYRWLGERLFPTPSRATQAADLTPESRRAWQRVIGRTLGTRPERPQSPPEVKLLASEKVNGYERRLIQYDVAPREPVKAYLCIPDKPTPLPGVLVLHQTEKVGKRESAGLAGEPNLAFGADLARRGYITLSPDSISAGERIDAFGPFDTRGHYLRHPNLSAMGKMLADAQVALDLLAHTPGVDGQRLGVIGHSLGAESALMLAAFDERARATIASCGYATMRADPERIRWARDAWFSYMPTLRPVLLQDRLPAWDWDDVLRLIAPRALFQYTAENDQIFKRSISAWEAGETIVPLWNVPSDPHRFVNRKSPGRHDLNVKEEAYQWLDNQLKRP